MLWLFGGGVLFARERIHLLISILRESLRLVKVEFFLLVDLLFEFPGRGECCSLLGAIFLSGPR